MPMKNPPHPGETVRYDCLEPLGLSVTEGAKVLGVTRQALNNLVNGKSGISPEMAIRLQKELIREWEAMPLSDAIQAGIRMMGRAYETDEPHRMVGAALARLRARKTGVAG